MVVRNLYDTLYFVPNTTQEFFIDGAFTCTTKQNTIFKAYQALQEAISSKKLEDFFTNYGVKVEKQIPAFAGLGGGSSDAATFLTMCNETLSLGLSTKELAQIGAKVGADVAFFLYGYSSANVEGIGEIVTQFDEEPLNFEILTPNIQGSTPAVYKTYREEFFAPISKQTAQELLRSDSKTLLENLRIEEANDLFLPALKLYPKLKEYAHAPWFFSGSGSSFFKKI
jgi:4-diphosphocytidyl-2-C-methyl-D-erythritol kinase